MLDGGHGRLCEQVHEVRGFARDASEVVRALFRLVVSTRFADLFHSTLVCFGNLQHELSRDHVGEEEQSQEIRQANLVLKRNSLAH